MGGSAEERPDRRNLIDVHRMSHFRINPLVNGGLELAEDLELLLGERGPTQLLVGPSELVVDLVILRGGSRGRLQVLDRLRSRSLGEQDLAEQVAGVGEIRLRLESAAQDRDRRLWPLDRAPSRFTRRGRGLPRGNLGPCRVFARGSRGTAADRRPTASGDG